MFPLAATQTAQTAVVGASSVGIITQQDELDGLAAQLDLVRSMRAAKVKSYAARTLGDISPKALQAISKFLDEEMMRTPEH